MNTRIVGLIACWAILSSFAVSAQEAGDLPVKVFLLAGQSNMEGKAPNRLFDLQAEAEGTREFFQHLRTGDQWEVRNDVFIKFLDRHGPLTIGYGSPDRTGIEFELGHILGEHFAEPVLLIKAAWGGHSLCKNFRPPSAGSPSIEMLTNDILQANKQVAERNKKENQSDRPPSIRDIVEPYGESYQEMLNEVNETREQLPALFPELKGREFEIAGFVWFQGWNDQYGGQNEYESNLKYLIHDLRRDLGCPNLPIVIAAMGQNMSKPAEGNMLIVQNAQLAMNSVPEFQGNVKTIRTDELVDKAAEALYPEWKERREEWDRIGGDHPYHYLGSPIWFTRIGRSLGEALLELL